MTSKQFLRCQIENMSETTQPTLLICESRITDSKKALRNLLNCGIHVAGIITNNIADLRHNIVLLKYSHDDVGEIDAVMTALNLLQSNQRCLEVIILIAPMCNNTEKRKVVWTCPTIERNVDMRPCRCQLRCSNPLIPFKILQYPTTKGL